jgi:predicted ATPase
MLQLQNLNAAKSQLNNCDPTVFINSGQSFRFFLKQIIINDFRHISNVDIKFDHPVTVITGTNKIGKTSLLLLIA